jgi:hypothetical protein
MSRGGNAVVELEVHFAASMSVTTKPESDFWTTKRIVFMVEVLSKR